MVKVYLDGAGLADMKRLAGSVDGFTTNPSLMRAAGVTDYRAFAREVLAASEGKPVSFEVLSDDFQVMERQAREIASWGENVWVKIPVMNTRGESSAGLIERLRDLRLNVTAVMTSEQMQELAPVVEPHHIVSVFAGRIHDANGFIPPIPSGFKAPVLWASTRQTFDLTIAEIRGFDLITMTAGLIAKLGLRGKDLHEYSRETVHQFLNDAKGITL
jgi:transaldolase